MSNSPPLLSTGVQYDLRFSLRTYKRKTGKLDDSFDYQVGERKLYINRIGIYYKDAGNWNTRMYGVYLGTIINPLIPSFTNPLLQFPMEEEIILYDEKTQIITLFNPRYSSSLARVIEIHGFHITQFMHENYITDYINRNNKTPYLKKVS